MRPALLLLALCTGCYDFTGDLGRLGFSSNLVLSDGAWTPDHAVAADTVLAVVPTTRLDVEADDDRGLAVQGDPAGSLSLVDRNGLMLWLTGTAGEGGVVRWHGEVRDRFSVRFASVAGAGLRDPALALAPGAPAVRDDRVALVGGTTWDARVAVRDARGDELGYDPSDLEVVADGGVSAWTDDAVVHVVADDPGALTLLLGGVEVGRVDVVPASAADIADVTVVRWTDDDVASALAVATLADGAPLFGWTPRWTWHGGPASDGGRPDVLVVPGGATDVRVAR